MPLPGTDTKVTALTEVIHRELQGRTELVRVRFQEMSVADRVKLCDYLARHDQDTSCELD